MADAVDVNPFAERRNSVTSVRDVRLKPSSISFFKQSNKQNTATTTTQQSAASASAEKQQNHPWKEQCSTPTLPTNTYQISSLTTVITTTNASIPHTITTSSVAPVMSSYQHTSNTMNNDSIKINANQSNNYNKENYNNNNTLPINKDELKDSGQNTPSAKRNRKSSGNSLQNGKKQKQQTLNNYWLGNNNNRYSLLNDESDDVQSIDMEVSDAKEKIPRPPPIYVSGVDNIQPLRALLEDIAKSEFQMKILSQGEVRIQPMSVEKYKAITGALDEKKTEFHTFKLKQERSFNVVLRGMHWSTPPEEIKEELEALGHQVVNISNVREKVTKRPLPLFYVNLKANSNNKDIYECTSLLHSKISFEPPRRKREIPQCTRCQRYGHTKGFCHHPPRCVKCPEPHLTVNCPRRNRSDGVRCVLCDGDHPANYRGCTVYKALQEKQYPPLRQRPSENQIARRSSVSAPQGGASQALSVDMQQNKGPVRMGPTSSTQTAISYSQALRDVANRTSSVKSVSKATNDGSTSQAGDMQELKNMLKTLMEQMGTMLNLLTALVAKMS